MTDEWNKAEDARIEAKIKETYPDLWAAGLVNPVATHIGYPDGTVENIEDDDRPLPDSLADIAAEHGVTEAQLRQALRESHPDAGVAEVILAAREIAAPGGVVVTPVLPRTRA